VRLTDLSKMRSLLSSEKGSASTQETEGDWSHSSYSWDEW
jgi:hypothetical protein